jgi:hypothetical protein
MTKTKETMANRGCAEFTLDEQFMCDVPYKRVFNQKPIESNKDLLDAIKQTDVMVVRGYDPHPEFERFRCQLEKDGYIKIERGWHNGDRVLRPFRLNGKLFKKHEQFPCAPAMGIHLKVWRKYRNKDEQRHMANK